MKKAMIVLLFVFISSFAYAQTYTRISGRILKNSIPQNQNTVELVSITGNPIFVTMPDYFGFYEFRVPTDYKGTLYLLLALIDHQYLKKQIVFPTNDRVYDLNLVETGCGGYTVNLWKDPDTVYEHKLEI